MKRKVKVILTAAIFTFCTAIGGCKAVESKLEPVYEALLQEDSVQEEKSVQASENQEMSTKEDLSEKESASVEDKEKETVGFTAVPAGTEQVSRSGAGAVKDTAFWRTPVKCVAFHDTLLHTEKPPYRFPHTAAECLFAEQVAVCAGAGQRQHQNIILYAVDKQPVRENMTFPMACPIAGQVMVTVLIRQRFAHCQQCYDLLQQLNLQATLDGSFVVFFETGRVLDGIFGFFHLFRSANNSSRSL